MITVTLKTGKVVQDKQATVAEDREGWVHLMNGKKELRMFPLADVEQVEFSHTAEAE